MKKRKDINTSDIINYLEELRKGTPEAEKLRKDFNKKLHKSTGDPVTDMFLNAINI